MTRRVNLLVCVALGVLGCGSDGDAQPGPPPAEAFIPLPSAAEIDAYARGAAAQVRWARRALRTKDSIRWASVDSVGAAAVGMPVERYRAVAQAVEAALQRAPQLDSLRIELMVLRMRVEERRTN